jgi:anthranilate synthase/aminodeoxychorismate synthase-like glutamine amidotransferase
MITLPRIGSRWAHRGEGEVVILDNRDSFVFNLAHRLHEVGARQIVVARSDEVDAGEVASWRPRAIVVSPGPGHPDDAGCSVEVIRRLGVETPILGVCLGHQAIGVAYGAQVSENGAPTHGRASVVEHDGRGVFAGLGDGVEVGRYHSLVIDPETLPAELEPTAWCGGFLMGVRHASHPVVGVQFHPESVLTGQGRRMLRSWWGGVPT